MGGYADVVNEDDNRPKTRAEADAQNAIGRGNRQDVGLGGYGGTSESAMAQAEYEAQRRREEQIKKNTQSEQERQRASKVGFIGATVTDTDGNVLNRYNVDRNTGETRGLNETIAARPRSMEISEFGDSETQRLVQGLPEESKFAAIGKVLELQRQRALTTPGTRDEKYYQDQVNLWFAQGVEGAAGEHAYKKQSTNPADWTANTRENLGDIALAIEKAGNEKDNFGKNYAFNPNVGSVLQVLPQRKNADGSVTPVGLQEYGWMEALARDHNQPAVGNVNWMPAIDFLNSQRGRQGIYGNLWGGTPDTFTPLPAGFANGGLLVRQTEGDNFVQGLKAPFISTVEKNTRDTTRLLNPFVVTAAGQDGAAGGMQLDWSSKKPFVSSLVQSKPETVRSLSFGGVISDFTKSFGAMASGDILGGIGMYSQGLSRFSTRAAMPNLEDVSTQDFGTALKVGFSAVNPLLIPGMISSGKSLDGVFEAGGAMVKEMYTTTRNDPVQDVALYLLPGAFKMGEGVVGAGIAKSAMSKNIMLSTAGRALSTPAAKTTGAAIKTGIAGLYIGQSSYTVLSAPNTPEGKGKAIGAVAYQLVWMGAGMGLANEFTQKPVDNIYDSRTFFSGERKLPLSEKVMIRAGDWVTGLKQTKGQRTAIQDISTEYGKNAFTKPPATTVEPNLADLTHVGKKNAPAIKQAMMEEPSVLYGSSTMDAQVGKTPMGAILRKTALPSKDVDVFTEVPTTTKARIQLLGGTKATAGTDIHAFPEGYPNVGQKANTQVQPGSYLFGNRYRTNPFVDEITLAKKTPGYKGDISFEHLNVQYRKLSSAVRDDIADPLNSGYRLGKDVSRLTRVGDVLSERTGTKSTAFDRMLQQKITYNEQVGEAGIPNIRTDTLFNIRARYESGRIGEVPDPVGNPYTKGAIPSALSKVAPGSAIVLRSSGSNPMLNAVSPSGVSSRSKSSVSSLSPGSGNYSGSSGRSSPPGASPGIFPASPSPSPGRTPPSLLPPYNPTSTPPGTSTYLTTTISPPYSPPPSRPSPPPSPPPSSPPSVIPTSTPTSPPSSPPSIPPNSPPVSPPPFLPSIFPSGGSSQGFPGERVNDKYLHENWVAAMGKGKKTLKTLKPFKVKLPRF